MGWLSLFVALVAIFAAVFWFLPAPPSANQVEALDTTAHPRGYPPLDIPGPVLATTVENVNLDGLTIIPLVHLPTIKLSFSIPFTQSRKVYIVVKPTLSETVLRKFRIASLSFSALDPGRQPSNTSLSGLTTDLSTSAGWSATLSIVTEKNKLPINGGIEGRDKRSGGKERIETWKYRTTGSTRLTCSLSDARMSLALQLVDPSSPKLAVLSTLFDAGTIHTLLLSHSAGSGIVNRVIPFVKDSFLLRRPVQFIAAYLASDVLEGGDVETLLRELGGKGLEHVDVTSWGGVTDEERVVEATKVLKDDPELATQDVEKDLKDIGTSAPPLPASSQPSPPTTSAAASSRPFKFHTHLLGPTLLHSFPLPSFSPSLYRPGGGGARALLQSFNPLTGPLSLNCTNVSLSSITFHSTLLHWDSDTLELVITLSHFSATLVGDLEISAKSKSILLSKVAGFESLSARASTSTVVAAHSLQVRFAKPPKASSISPFTTITPTVSTPIKLLALGSEIVNTIMGSAKNQIAMAASVVVGGFVKDQLGGLIEEGLGKGRERLEEMGVEWEGGSWS